MSCLTERVCRTIVRDRLLPPGARVIAAASGGADSTALVCVLAEAAAPLQIEFVGIAHFNHMLRAGACDEDERFCQSLAGRFSLPFDAGRANVRAASRRWRTSIEDAGRRLRYAFLAEAARRAGATHVAVGHTRDDQAETVLLNLLRGAGTLGLGGMPVRRGPFVRPLIDCRHRELVDYLAASGVPFREDESNADRRYFRNRVRHEILPALEAAVPSVRDLIARTAESARTDAEYLERLASAALATVGRDAGEGSVVLDAGALDGLPLALARRVARLALARAGGGAFVGFEQVERLLALARGELRGPRAFAGASASVDAAGRLVLERVEGRSPAVRRDGSGPRTFSPKPLSIPGEAAVDAGLWLSSELRPGGLDVIGRVGADLDPRTAVVDAALVSDLAVRFREPGDTFRPLGLAGHKKLQDFFVDRKVPRAERDRTPLVVDGANRVVWVAGRAISEDFRVSEATRAVVILKLRGERR